MVFKKKLKISNLKKKKTFFKKIKISNIYKKKLDFSKKNFFVILILTKIHNILILII